MLYGLSPDNFSIDKIDKDIRSSRDIDNDLADDSIVDLRDGSENIIFVGTSGGMSMIDLSSGVPIFFHFEDPQFCFYLPKELYFLFYF